MAGPDKDAFVPFFGSSQEFLCAAGRAGAFSVWILVGEVLCPHIVKSCLHTLIGWKNFSVDACRPAVPKWVDLFLCCSTPYFELLVSKSAGVRGLRKAVE
jgi:hypothetical protein